MKYRLIFFIFLLNVHVANSQTNDVISAKLSEQIPNSPEVLNFTKYGIIPVTLYSGMTNVSIPLYKIKDGSLEVPISLNYYSNGLKPAEIANNTGLGWTAQAGGMITRIVRGQVDENPIFTDINNYFGFAPLQMKYEDFPDISTQIYSQKILKEISDGVTDGEPDIYSYSIDGYHGYFIIKNGQAILTPKQNLRVDVINSFEGISFKIFSENGTIYSFDAPGFEITQPNDFHQQLPVYVRPYISAWHLTSITSFDKHHVIEFSYEPVNLKREDDFSGVYDLTAEGGMAPTGVYKEVKNYGATITGKIISSISTLTGNCKVNFIKNTIRQDICDYQGLRSIKALDSLLIKTQSGDLIKKWKFNYGYFGSNQYKKLKLLSLLEVDKNGYSTISQSFNYFDENLNLPDNKTRGIDHWGYFNGRTSNTCLIPSDILPFGTLVTTIPGDRSPDFNSCLMTVLSKITYPTGGYSTFTYEPNRYYKSKGTDFLEIPMTVDLYAAYSPQEATIDIDNNLYVNKRQTFAVCFPQKVNFYYKFTMPNFTSTSTGVKIFYPVFTIRKIWNTCDDSPSINPDLILYNKTGQFYPIDNNGTYQIIESIDLDPGTYEVQIKIDSEISTFYSSLAYSATDGTLDPGKVGPGLRISSIKNYDLNNSKTSEKKYEYLADNGTSSGIGTDPLYRISSYDELVFISGSLNRDIIHTSISGSLEQNVGTLLNDKLYYSKVSEYSIGTTGNQRIDYFYNSFDAQNSGVKMIKQNIFSNENDNFKIIQSKDYEYCSVYQDWDIISLKSKFVGKRRKEVVVGDFSPLVPYPNIDDPLDPVSHLEFYEGSLNSLWVADLKLISETETNYYYSPSVYYVTTKKSYKYSSIHPQNPYQIEVSTSSNKDIQIDRKYCYDYDLLNSSTKTLNQINDEYLSSLTSIISNYGATRTTDINGFKTYYNSYKALVLNRNNEIKAFDIALQSQITNENIPEKKAILIMQKDNNIITPIEQQNFFIDNLTRKFSGALKTVFGISDVNCVVDKETWTYELSNPIDISEFNSTNYVKKIEKTYNSDLNIVHQKMSNDIDHSYVWGYNKNYLIAETKNAATSECGFTGFENDESNSFPIPGYSVAEYVNESYSGKKALKVSSLYGPGNSFTVGDNAIIHSGYKASVWVKGGTDAYLHIQVNDDWNLSRRVKNPNNNPAGGWNLIEVVIPYNVYKDYINSNLRIGVYCGNESGGSAIFDDLRFYPMDAQMTTYTYRPLIGVSSISDVNNKPTYYEYDAFNRLWYIKDFKGNILKKYNYHYKP